VRPIEANGEHILCPCCDERVKFIIKQPAAQRRQVVANIYEHGRWDRLEIWHLACYLQAGQPHGVVVIPEQNRR
jgi:hypothetical protein